MLSRRILTRFSALRLSALVIRASSSSSSREIVKTALGAVGVGLVIVKLPREAVASTVHAAMSIGLAGAATGFRVPIAIIGLCLSLIKRCLR
jgi:hypothetical protein